MIVDVAVAIENAVCEAVSAEEHAGFYGTRAEWEAADERLSELEFWADEWERLFPGASLCEHGLSYQLCYGPAHYASHDEIRMGW